MTVELLKIVEVSKSGQTVRASAAASSRPGMRRGETCGDEFRHHVRVYDNCLGFRGSYRRDGLGPRIGSFGHFGDCDHNREGGEFRILSGAPILRSLIPRSTVRSRREATMSVTTEIDVAGLLHPDDATTVQRLRGRY